jgi:FMN-dependent NADH-azoreductase
MFRKFVSNNLGFLFNQTIQKNNFYTSSGATNMKNILVINSSLKNKSSHSKTLADFFIKNWMEKFPQDKVIHRDVGQDIIPHLTEESIIDFSSTDQTAVAKPSRKLSDKLIDELQNADRIVLAAPMYNFTIPSTLKSYFDYVVRVGKTVGYNDKGAYGMIQDKPVLVITTGGGNHDNSDRDFQAPLVKQLLNYIGLKDVTFVRAHGLLLSDDLFNTKISQAKDQIKSYVEHSTKKIFSTNASTLFNQQEAKEFLEFKKENILVRFPNEKDLNADVIEEVCTFINKSYDEAEKGMWKKSDFRTNIKEVENLLKDKSFLLAEFNNKIVGCIRVDFKDQSISEFGMLVTHPNYRRLGIGSKLINAAEEEAVKMGRSFMSLKLLAPINSKLDHKEFLKSWYGKLGYVKDSTEAFNESNKIYLESSCEFTVFQKALPKPVQKMMY